MVQGRRPHHLLPGRRPKRLQGLPLRRGRSRMGRGRRGRPGRGHGGAPQPLRRRAPGHGRDLLSGHPRQLGSGGPLRPDRPQRSRGCQSRSRAHRRRPAAHVGRASGAARRHRDAPVQGPGARRGARPRDTGWTHPLQRTGRHLQSARSESLPLGLPRTRLSPGIHEGLLAWTHRAASVRARRGLPRGRGARGALPVDRARRHQSAGLRRGRATAGSGQQRRRRGQVHLRPARWPLATRGQSRQGGSRGRRGGRVAPPRPADAIDPPLGSPE